MSPHKHQSDTILISEKTKFSWPVMVALVMATAALYEKMDYDHGKTDDKFNVVLQQISDIKVGTAQNYETINDHTATIDSLKSSIKDSQTRTWDKLNAVENAQSQLTLSVQVLTDTVKKQQ